VAPEPVATENEPQTPPQPVAPAVATPDPATSETAEFTEPIPWGAPIKSEAPSPPAEPLVAEAPEPIAAAAPEATPPVSAPSLSPVVREPEVPAYAASIPALNAMQTPQISPSLEEMDAAPGPRIMRLDTNNDGVVDAEELEAGATDMRKNRHRRWCIRCAPRSASASHCPL